LPPPSATSLTDLTARLAPPTCAGPQFTLHGDGNTRRVVRQCRTRNDLATAPGTRCGVEVIQ
jgi:hypothetical protein